MLRLRALLVKRNYSSNTMMILGSLLTLVSLLLPVRSPAQESQCSVLAQINMIEANIGQITESESQSKTPPAGTIQHTEALLDDLRNRRARVLVADQVFGNANWLNDYIESRTHLLALLESDHRDMISTLASSGAYLSLSRQVASLGRIIRCVPGASENDGPDSQNAAGHLNTSDDTANYAPAPLGLAANFTQILAQISDFVSEESTIIVPFAIFLGLFALIWGYMKYDEHRFNMRRRYLCHIEAQIAGRFSSQEGYITDISRIGVGLHLTTPIPVGSKQTLSCKGLSEKIQITRISDNTAGAKFIKHLKKIPDGFDLSGPKKWVSKQKFNSQEAATRNNKTNGNS